MPPNPRIGFYHPAQQSGHLSFDRREVIVTEGIIDALSANAAGWRSAAVLSASYGDPVAARALARVDERLVIAFDPDPAGRHGAERLVNLLNAQHRPPGVMVLRTGDLNDCLAKSGDWPVKLAGRVQHATAQLGQVPSRSVGRAI